MHECVLQHAKDSQYEEDDISLSYLHCECPDEIHELKFRFIFLVNGFLDDEVCASLRVSIRKLSKYENSNSKWYLLSSRTIKLAPPSSLL